MIGNNITKIREDVKILPPRHCFIGVGKSAIVAHLLAETFSSCSIPSYHLNAADAIHGGMGQYRHEDVTVWISKSGNTKELLDLAQYLPVDVAITHEKSSLAGLADKILPLDATEHFYNVPTASVLRSLDLGYALLLEMMSTYGLNEQDFTTNHPGGDIGRLEREAVADYVVDAAEFEHPARTGDVATNMTRGIAIFKTGEKVVGIATDGDVRRSYIPGQPAKINENFIAIRPDALIRYAIDLCIKVHNINSLVVIDEGKYLGVVHLHDMLKGKKSNGR